MVPPDPLAECAAVGSRALLGNVKLGLFCSIHCPGKLVVRTYELVRGLRDAGVTLVGGFHSPMEQQCLRLVLRGGSPVIVCPARSVKNMRLPADWQAPLQAGRLLLISPFAANLRRITRATAMQRNEFVADLADVLLVAYAEPGSRTERVCRAAVAHGKRVLTFRAPENQHLFAHGSGAVQALADDDVGVAGVLSGLTYGGHGGARAQAASATLSTR